MDKTSVYDTPANNLLGWTNRGVDEAQWNAALIVAAINNLPALLEIAEASSRMENDAWEAHDGTDNWVVEDRHMVALSDALALLPNPQGSPGAAPVHPAVGRMQEQPETTEKGQ
jgi:hypothetical protein